MADLIQLASQISALIALMSISIFMIGLASLMVYIVYDIIGGKKK